MRIVGVYSFKGGKEAVEIKYQKLLEEVKSIISHVDSEKYKTKKSREKTMKGRLLYSPKRLNSAFKRYFIEFGWHNHRVHCDYSIQYYTPDYTSNKLNKGAFREMDFIKEKLGIEVQFGKYAFMVYNVCAKMTIFSKLGYIDTGIEIVPVKNFADKMSTGVSYFEQFVWDLEQRGVADIDIPVLVLGIDK
ncbi:MAG TPA: BglII/BstYI family type II restriction endonuclease [Candidatus Wujingus californicus]|uniref:BglII/BstYI family type II restriction endonuclease n=1 Tax=Candidatus Wujingus californicus TaxID=3367618 RepID=UPI001DC26877|nr:restriction endonuclease [Planctomycetota bacterium]MDO8132130.1 BglII/BstYI family type II restriction endonuclease [Candidatus Brocadiales bacterium]